jgi:ABC-type nitrate/sulfonate/bicarbonate transport system permease component
MRRVIRGLGHLALVVWPAALVAAAWQAWIVLGDVPPAVAPRPAAVMRFVLDNKGSYLRDAWDFVVVVVTGTLLGTAAGVVLAVTGWLSSFVRSLISPLSLVTQCLPIVVMVPILGRLFGYEPRTIIVIAAIIAFFPSLVFTSRGLTDSPPGSDDLFTVLGANRWRRFRLLAGPAAIPHLLLSLRLAVIGAVIGALVGQWILGTQGLGYRLALAQSTYRTADAWGSALLTVAVSILLLAVTTAASTRAAERFE